MKRLGSTLLLMGAWLGASAAGCTGSVGGGAGGGSATGGSPGSSGGATGTGGRASGATGGSNSNGTGGRGTGGRGTGGQGTAVTPDGSTTDLTPHAPFVAVGYGALRAYSADGKSWTTAPAPTTLPAGWSGSPTVGDNQWNLRGGCNGLGMFLAVGGTTNDDGMMLSSTNGTTWSLVGGQMSNDGCAYGNGRFLTNVRTSTDGKTWTSISTQISSRQMVFGKGMFVSVGDNGGGDVHYSTDGKTWQALPITYTGTDANRLGYDALAYGNGRFVAINLMISSSPIFEWDGASTTSFTETPRASLIGSNVAVTALAYGQGSFVIATANSLYRMADGATTWQSASFTGAAKISSLVITDTLYVSDTSWSADGVTFKDATNAPGGGGLVNLIIPTLQ